MNWFKDMAMLFGEWFIYMIVALLLGVFIGWLIWGTRRKKDNDAIKEEPTRAKVNDDLTAIKGINADLQAKLNENGISSYYDLAVIENEEVDKLASEFNFENDRIRNENWVPQAAQLHFEKYDLEIYDKVSVEAVYADAFEKQLAEANKGVRIEYVDDLKIISGVGPKLEKMLHEFGIKSFYQLSQLDNEGINALNEKIKFFPGRMERDNWIGQAKELHKKLHE